MRRSISSIPRVRRIRLASSLGVPRGKVLFGTNMWPDEERPYYGSFIASQASSLTAAGFSVDVAYVRGFKSIGAYVRALGSLPTMANGTYDVHHLHYGHTAAAGAATALRKVPLVVSYCGEDLLGAPRGNSVSRKSAVEVALFRHLSHLADRTITKSAEMEQVLPKSRRAFNTILPNGVDLSRFSPIDRHLARQRLGWALETPVLLFLGNPADPRKNVALARRTAELVRVQVPDARLHEAWQVDPSDVPLLLGAADVLVFSSLSEGSPNAVKEAMACELPVVASPVGDLEERLRGVDGTYLCKPNSATEFADAVMRVLREPGKRALEARRAVSSLSTEHVATRLVDVYRAAGARIV